MKEKINIQILDDHGIFREGLRLLLEREKYIEIVGESSDLSHSIEAIGSIKPDMILLSPIVSSKQIHEIIPAIREASPTTKVLLISADMNEEIIIDAIKAGAKGYVSKSSSAAELGKAIQAVHNGELWVERKTMAKLMESEIIPDAKIQQKKNTKGVLTPREQEVLHLLVKGYTNKEIAQELAVSEKTVKSHLSNIFKKFNVTRRLQAILHAIKRGLS